MYSFINCTCHQKLLELRKKVRMNVTWYMCTWLSEIINHTEQPTPLLGACRYNKLQTQWHNHCCHRWLNSPSLPLYSHCSNTFTILTVVILEFWLCQCNTGTLARGLCLSLSTKFFCLFVCSYGFSICILGYCWWS